MPVPSLRKLSNTVNPAFTLLVKQDGVFKELVIIPSWSCFSKVNFCLGMEEKRLYFKLVVDNNLTSYRSCLMKFVSH